MNLPATRHLTNHEEYADAVIDLFEHSRREVALFTPDLIANIYDRPALVDAVRSFALRDKNTRLRILVRSSESIVAEGRRLVDLAHRLASSIAFRKLAGDFGDRADAFVTADGTHYAIRRQASTWDGLYDHSRPEIARQLATDFNEMWEHSSPDPNLRRLHV